MAAQKWVFIETGGGDDHAIHPDAQEDPSCGAGDGRGHRRYSQGAGSIPTGTPALGRSGGQGLAEPVVGGPDSPRRPGGSAGGPGHPGGGRAPGTGPAQLGTKLVRPLLAPPSGLRPHLGGGLFFPPSLLRGCGRRPSGQAPQGRSVGSSFSGLLHRRISSQAVGHSGWGALPDEGGQSALFPAAL